MADVSPPSSPLMDVSWGGTSATQRQKFHTDDVNQCLHNKSSSHGVPNGFLLVDFGNVLCWSANKSGVWYNMYRLLHSCFIFRFSRFIMKIWRQGKKFLIFLVFFAECETLHIRLSYPIMSHQVSPLKTTAVSNAVNVA